MLINVEEGLKQELESKLRYINDYPRAGVRFVDFSAAMQDSYWFNSCAKILEAEVSSEKYKTVRFIVSPEARGFAWGSVIARKLNCGLITLRKPGKLPEQWTKTICYKTEYSNDELQLPLSTVDIENMEVLFVDDLYATGGTYKAAKELLASEGAKVIGGVCIMSIVEGNTPVEIKSIF